MSSQYLKQGNFLSVPQASESHRSLAGKQVFIGQLNGTQFKGGHDWACWLEGPAVHPSGRQVAQWAQVPLKTGRNQPPAPASGASKLKLDYPNSEARGQAPEHPATHECGKEVASTTDS